MHSTYARISALSANLSTALLVLVGLIASTTFVFTAQPTGKVGISSVKVYTGRNVHYGQLNHEYSFVRLDVNADLTPLFNWNTKQLFVYIVGEYESANGTRNEIVVWDRIVRRQKDAHIRLQNAKAKYMVRDLKQSLGNVSAAHYSLRYNVMPHVGLLTYGEAARTEEPVSFPPAQRKVS